MTSRPEKIAIAHGFRLARESKHRVLRRGDGKVFVLPNTPSDRRYEHNALSDLAHLLGKRKSELTEGRLPLRATRERGTLAPLPALIHGTEKPQRSVKLTSKQRRAIRLQHQERQAAESKAARHEQRQLRDMSAGDRAAAHRAERERRETAAEQADKIRRLMAVVFMAWDVWMEREHDSDNALGIAHSTVLELEHLGWMDCEVVLVSPVGTPIREDGAVRGFPMIRCGQFYLDFLDRDVHTSSSWTTPHGEDVEAVVSLKDMAKSAGAGK